MITCTHETPRCTHIRVTGSEIGDMLRSWETHHGRLSERRWSAAWTAASNVAREGHNAVRGAIHATLTRSISH